MRLRHGAAHKGLAARWLAVHVLCWCLVRFASRLFNDTIDTLVYGNGLFGGMTTDRIAGNSVILFTIYLNCVLVVSHFLYPQCLYACGITHMYLTVVLSEEQ
mgnify:CR=1 FL=1